MEKLKREQQKDRKSLEKAFNDAFRVEVKARRWGYLKPSAFFRQGEWFVQLDPMIWTDVRRSRFKICVKPFALDDLVSRIMLYDGLEGKNLSLRVRGPHCLVRPMFEVSIESDNESVANMIEMATQFGDETVSQIGSLTLDEFITFSGDDTSSDRVSFNQVAALILADRNAEAALLCERAIATKQWGGPTRMTEDGRLISFFDLAQKWIRTQ